MSENKVKIIAVGRPDYSDIESTCFEMLDAVGAPMLVSGRRVLIKVNLMLGGPPELGTNTHPAVAAALVRYVRRLGGEAGVGDSSGALGLTDACFEASGMKAAVEKAKGRVVNLEASEMDIAFLNGRLLKVAVMPKILDEYDLIISAAKLKVHPLTGMTGAVKNLMGLLPGAVKPRVHHRFAWTPKRLAEALLEIYAVKRPAISFVDGIIGRQGGGSTNGHPIRASVLAASRDGLALDAWCTDRMGLARDSVPLLAIGAEKGLGRINPGDWEVITRDLPEPVAFDPSSPDLKARPLIGALAYLLRDYGVRPVFPRQGCGDCDKCVQLCPTDALQIKNGVILRKRFRCVGCYACVHLCPSGQARFKVAGYARKLFWKKAAGLVEPKFLK